LLDIAVENAEVAMYEALAVVADMAGDPETAALARRIQAQEQETADKVWRVIATSATQAYQAVSTRDGSESRTIVRRYVEDAEAAERNFEDALVCRGTPTECHSRFTTAQ
jgi:rubrerythrin